MQLSSVLSMLLGAALVAIGVLAAALADRIRTVRSQQQLHEQQLPREQQQPRLRRPRARGTSPGVETADRLQPPSHPSHPTASQSVEGADVIAALVAAGYKKTIAADATWACTTIERSTIETWTAAALRRCARGLS